jgi:hypothetical protein
MSDRTSVLAAIKVVTQRRKRSTTAEICIVTMASPNKENLALETLASGRA